MPRSNAKGSLNGGAPMRAALQVFFALAGCFLFIAPWPAMAAPAKGRWTESIRQAQGKPAGPPTSGRRHSEKPLDSSGAYNLPTVCCFQPKK